MADRRFVERACHQALDAHETDNVDFHDALSTAERMYAHNWRIHRQERNLWSERDDARAARFTLPNGTARRLFDTDEDIQRMLRVIGVDSVDDLFQVIPEALRLAGDLDLPPPLCEADLLQHLKELGALNQPQSRETGVLVFAGAGLYPHQVPAAVDALAGRSEFYTAYTPYQPELSQARC